VQLDSDEEIGTQSFSSPPAFAPPPYSFIFPSASQNHQQYHYLPTSTETCQTNCVLLPLPLPYTSFEAHPDSSFSQFLPASVPANDCNSLNFFGHPNFKFEPYSDDDQFDSSSSFEEDQKFFPFEHVEFDVTSF